MSLIKCENASFSYDGKEVLKDINFSVESDDYICVVGENGSGKSTLVKGILQLKKQDKGSIVFSKDLSFKEIGYLPQQTEVQKDFPGNVFEVVLSGCINKLGYKPFFTQKEKNIALENLKKLQILDLKNKCYRDLSGGQQQRVLLARALCASSKLLILDEPVTGLDPIVTKELYDLIDKINKEFNIAIIMISHDINAALNNSKKILHLNNAQLFFGTKEEYIKNEIGKNFIGDKKDE